jgi:hypothetical protein
MLNLKIVMTPLTLLPIILLGLSSVFQVITSDDVIISSPETGSEVEGVVEIHGNVPQADFSTAKVTYSYAGDDDSWFLITRLDHSVEDGILATWDTSTITDGIYQIRLTVKTVDGAKFESIVTDVRVANYSPLATHPNESETVVALQTYLPVETSTMNAATPLAANPAAISDAEIKKTILAGGITGAAVVIMFILWLSIKNHLTRN